MNVQTVVKRLLVILVLAALLLTVTGCGLARRGKSGFGANSYTSNDKVEVFKDIAYYDGSTFNRNKHILDVYIPKKTKNFPTIFFVHGGAWVGGDKAQTAKFGMTLASHGIAVVDINYRLYPDVKYPRFVEDVARAFRWTMKNISKFGGDPGRIFVAGHSAGAHLVALISTNDRFLNKVGYSPNDILGTIAISGIYRMDDKRFRRIFSDDKEDASPVYHVGKTTPPFLVFYASNDIVDLDHQAELMAQALRKGNVPRELIRVKNRNHGSILNKIGTENDPVLIDILRFIKKYD